MSLSQSAMLLLLEMNPLLKYELSFPEDEQLLSKKYKTKENSHLTKYWKLKKDPKKFFVHTHMDTKVFDYILECVREKLKRPDANLCKIKSAEDKVFITIGFMASGLSIRDLSKNTGLPYGTVKQIISTTLTTIWETLHDVHLKPPIPAEMPASAEKFHTRWKFPNAVGAIGAKFIPTKLTTPQAYNSEKTLRRISLVLTAVADADFRFSTIDVTKNINEPEETTFDSVFGNAGFRMLPGSTDMMPYVILGNDTFPLKTHLLRPYNETAHSFHENSVSFNIRLATARVAIEAAFEILTEKFTVFSKPILLELDMVGLIVKTGCLLHNIVKDIDGDFDPHFRDIGKEDNGYLNLFLVKKKMGMHDDRPTMISDQIRNVFRDYIVELT